ncbi:tetratricopeptide repeat protein 9C-like [Eriocheir sinensis]|uniref:tetratricopeptide repeat protein 9C-like n=1 Tax=Eriocheir sinensis TaxID=95602 RepID=UPI0021C73398|nr:tetratricopeptide repeat protein 9C-like [Eriocheir sinensis]XP_050723152.1 tetratricopeptide repeat protein 9C-like [Eriocheir sinensis]XP_050723153.1 tetratricopeptide repeat protein 9C-like [Eriocheir sinensis]
MAAAGGPSVETVVKEKLVKAKEFKVKGNEHFKQQQVKKAIKSYHSGLLYLKGINQDLNPNKLLVPTEPPPTITKEAKAEVDSLSADLHNNIAACLLKLEPVKYERVVECCQEVTELQPNNVKGWYRLGLAHHNLRNFDAAKDALKAANQIAEGQDMAVRKLMVAVDQELKRENQKFNDMFKNSLLAKKT